MLTNKKVLMLVSLLISIGLWMFVMGNVDPRMDEHISGVEVEMVGTDSLEAKGLTATLNQPKIVTVVVEGKRSQIKKVKQKGVTAYIDVSTCDYGKNEAEIHVRLPEGIKGVAVDDLSSETAVFTVK